MNDTTGEFQLEGGAQQPATWTRYNELLHGHGSMTCNMDTVQQHATINNLQHGHGPSTCNYRHGSTTSNISANVLFNFDESIRQIIKSTSVQLNQNSSKKRQMWVSVAFLYIRLAQRYLQHGHGSMTCNMDMV